MNKLINDIFKRVDIKEGKHLIEKFLISVYFQEGISAKELSRKLNLPIPIISAIKNEFKKHNIIKVQSGIRLTDDGITFVNKNLGYENLNLNLYNNLIKSMNLDLLQDEINTLDCLLKNRPPVDVTVDQSKCTSITSVKRALLALEKNCLINKNILCLGDDDLISVSLSILIKSLYNKNGIKPQTVNTRITAADIDERILDYIKTIAEKYDLPINCVKYNLKDELPFELLNKFDCIFTDPPYTIEGLKLFLSRGVSALKNESSLPIFLSFGHKSPPETLNMQEFFWRSGLEITDIYNNYNFYEGAEIIGNTSDMIILNSTIMTIPLITDHFNGIIYTGELKKTVRIYECINCKKKFKVSIKNNIKTIEELKNKGCSNCSKNKFILKQKHPYNLSEVKQ